MGMDSYIWEALDEADRLTDQRGRMSQAKILLGSVNRNAFIEHLSNSGWVKCHRGFIDKSLHLVITLKRQNEFWLGRNY